MVTEAPSLYPEVREAAGPPGRGKHGYYKSEKGWVLVASTTPSNRADWEYKGYTFLPQYGEFINGTNQPGAKQKERDARGLPWNPAIEPYRLIFQKDGAKEFPAAQVIAYRWHIRPPYREVTFPQLEGLDITNYQCPECNKGLFSSTSAAEAAEQLKTHLTCQIDGRHKYTPRDLKELENEWGVRFETARVGRRSVVVAPQAEEAAEVPEMVVDGEPKVLEEFRCQRCKEYAPLSDNKNPAGALRLHGRHCKAAP